MRPGLHITARCLITRNRAYKNGQLIFEHAGSAAEFLDAAYTHFAISYPKFHKMDQLCKLGLLATDLLLKDTGHLEKYAETETGLVLSNANASLDVDLKYAKTIPTGASPALFVYTLPNIVIGEISIRWHFKGENAFFVFKQFDGNFIEKYVNSLFENNLVKNCICGWVDFLKEDYRALLFLVETSGTENAITFTADHLNQLNQQEHG
ncbi:MAG TPA: beta-ketoacyl synthase N-terminal-like domain-containing protein [Puia sp.]|nr:beta-ketoacyl synthase N-terminal-like domain-containing protein [Puia sp.]